MQSTSLYANSFPSKGPSPNNKHNHWKSLSKRSDASFVDSNAKEEHKRECETFDRCVLKNGSSSLSRSSLYMRNMRDMVSMSPNDPELMEQEKEEILPIGSPMFNSTRMNPRFCQNMRRYKNEYRFFQENQLLNRYNSNGMSVQNHTIVSMVRKKAEPEADKSLFFIAPPSSLAFPGSSIVPLGIRRPNAKRRKIDIRNDPKRTAILKNEIPLLFQKMKKPSTPCKAKLLSKGKFQKQKSCNCIISNCSALQIRAMQTSIDLKRPQSAV